MVVSERELLLNAFQPDRELESFELFSGRRSELSDLVDGLHSSGSCPVVFGDRGLGKTSLALQLRNVSWGMNDLLVELDLADRFLDVSNSFISILVNCSEDTADTQAVLARVYRALTNIDASQGDRGFQLTDRTTKTRLSFKVFERETSRRFSREAPNPDWPEPRSELDLEEAVVGAARTLHEITGQRILVFVDELDRVRDTSGLASFLRNANTPFLKFVLIGIAQDLSNLLLDHQSLERKLRPVEVRAMGRGELKDIAEKAAQSLTDKGLKFSFEERAKSRLARLAQGFPWFVHILGQSALLIANEDGRNVVTEDDVNQSVQSLVDNRFALQFSDTYQRAVRDSRHREIMLRLFSQWRSRDIPTADIYRLASTLGVTGPSVYRGHLTQDHYGGILVAPPMQSRGLVRFRNEMFKVYARIRPSLYEGVDEEVLAAWNRR